MLHFEPSRRITVEEALEHPFLRDVRHPELEITAPGHLTMAIDKTPFLVGDDIRKNVYKFILFLLIYI